VSCQSATGHRPSRYKKETPKDRYHPLSEDSASDSTLEAVGVVNGSKGRQGKARAAISERVALQ
jgi:hypothetical protein